MWIQVEGIRKCNREQALKAKTLAVLVQASAGRTAMSCWCAHRRRWCVCWDMKPHKNLEIHIDVSHSRQPLVKGERLVRYEVNTVMPALCRHGGHKVATLRTCDRSACFSAGKRSAALRASAPGQARPVQKSIASQRDLFTQRVRCSWRSAMPGQHA